MKNIIASLAISVIVLGPSSFGQSKLDRAKSLLNEGRNAEAVAALQTHILDNSRDGMAWYLLSTAYESLGRLDSAEIAGAKAIQYDDENQDAYVVLSRVQLNEKKVADAFTTLRAGIRAKKQDYAPLLVGLGRALLMADSADGALVAFSRAREITPNDPAVYDGLGDSYAKQGVAPLAITQYERAVELDSTRVDVLYKMANLHMKERQYNEAAKVYNLILAIQPTNDAARLELGQLYFRAKQYVNSAKILKDYIRRHPEASADILGMYLDALYQSRQYIEAEPFAKKYLKLDPKSAIAYRVIATVAVENRKYDEAIKAFDSLAKFDTLQTIDSRRLALAYSQTGRDSLAATTLDAALILDSTNAMLFGEAGTAWMKLKNWARAGEMFKRRFELDTTAVAAYINYGACMMQLEDFEDARKAFERATTLNPDYPPAWLRLASCLFQLKNYEEGRAAALKAIQSADTAVSKYRLELADANRMVGLSYLLEKKWEEGVRYLRESVKMKEDEVQSHLLLAQALQNLQKNEEAYKEYQRTLKLDPKNEAAKKGYETLKIIVE